MTAREMLIKDATECVRIAHAYEKAISVLLQRAEIMAHCVDLSDGEVGRMTFLREKVCIIQA